MSAIFCMLSTKRALYLSKSTSVICLPQSRNPSEAGHVPNATVKVDRDKLAALMTPDALTLLTLLTLFCNVETLKHSTQHDVERKAWISFTKSEPSK